MQDILERRNAVNAVFAATGIRVDESDPIILAALFQAHITREAGKDAAGQMVAASKTVQAAADAAKAAASEAAAVMRVVAADRKAVGDAIEARVKKAVLEAVRSQSSQASFLTAWRGVLGGFVLGILIAVGATGIACGFSFSWIEDAAIGRAFTQMFSTLEPEVQAKLIAHTRKRFPH